MTPQLALGTALACSSAAQSQQLPDFLHPSASPSSSSSQSPSINGSAGNVVLPPQDIAGSGGGCPRGPPGLLHITHQIPPQHEGQYQSDIEGSTKDCTEDDDDDNIISSHGFENDFVSCSNTCTLLGGDKASSVSAQPNNPANPFPADAIREHCWDPLPGEGLEAFEHLSCSLSSIRERLTQVQSKLIMHHPHQNQCMDA